MVFNSVEFEEKANYLNDLIKLEYSLVFTLIFLPLVEKKYNIPISKTRRQTTTFCKMFNFFFAVFILCEKGHLLVVESLETRKKKHI